MLAAQEMDLHRLQDRAATKRWLKRARQQRQHDDRLFDFF